MLYQKVPTIANAFQVSGAGNLGLIGIVSLDDWVVIGADGTYNIWSDVDFQLYWNLTSQDSTPTGIDYEAPV